MLYCCLSTGYDGHCGDDGDDGENAMAGSEWLRGLSNVIDQPEAVG